MTEDERLALLEIMSMAASEIEQVKLDMQAQRGINAAILARVKMLEDALTEVRAALDLDYDEVDDGYKGEAG